MPAGHVATGFSMKTFLPRLMASANCAGLNPGGVAMMTRFTSSSASNCLYASRPVKHRLAGTLNSSFKRPRESSKASARATISTPCEELTQSRAAPDPRPPQPMTPTRIVLLPLASARGPVAPVSTSVPAAKAELFKSSRRVSSFFCTMFVSPILRVPLKPVRWRLCLSQELNRTAYCVPRRTHHARRNTNYNSHRETKARAKS